MKWNQTSKNTKSYEGWQTLVHWPTISTLHCDRTIIHYCQDLSPPNTLIEH